MGQRSHVTFTTPNWAYLSSPHRCLLVPSGRDSTDALPFQEWQSWVMCPTCSYSQLTFIKPLLCARPYAVEGWEVSCLRCGSLQLSSNWRMDHWMKAGLDHCLNVDRPYVFNFLILCVKALLCTSSLLESWVNWSWMWATVLPQCHGGPLSPFLLFITYPIILQLHWIFIQQPLCG